MPASALTRTPRQATRPAALAVTLAAAMCLAPAGADVAPTSPEPPDLDALADLRLDPQRTGPQAHAAPADPRLDRASGSLLAQFTSASDGGARYDPLPAPPALIDRRDGAFDLEDTLRLEFASLGFDAGRGDPFSRVRFTGARAEGDAVQRRLDLVDLSFAWDAFRLGSDSPVTLSLLSGVRATRYGARVNSADGLARREDSALDATPTGGLRLTFDVAPGLSVRTGGSLRADEISRERIDLSADLAFALSNRAAFSVGFERTAGALEAQDLSADVSRSVVFARVSLRF